MLWRIRKYTSRVRFLLWRLRGVKAQPCAISQGCKLTGPRLTIGRATYIGPECFFDTTAPITLGSKCNLAMRVTVATSSHEPGDAARRAGPLAAAPVAIGDGTWVGAGVLILPGVNIGAGCVIAAGAVVTVDCEPHGLYGGVPARRLRDLD